MKEPRRHKPGLFFLSALALAFLAGPDAGAATATGPFTEAQMRAGRIAFMIHCTGCHGSYLLGNSGPPLVGAPFLEDWAGKSTHDLFRFAANNMPFNAAGTLAQEDYLNLVAFILAVNGARPGTQAFTPESDVTIGSLIDGNIVVGVVRGEEDFGNARRGR